jgi:lipoate-protein ligase A
MTELDLALPTLAENLALDEALLLHAEAGQGGEVLRFWESPRPGIVLGISGQVEQEVHVERCGDVPILRRSSGGGAVLVGPGCLCYTLVLSYDRAEELRQIGCSYCFILGKLSAALGQGVAPAGTSDLAVGDRKVSGNSQQRKRSYLLHHGTILYDFDLASLTRYLKPPPRQPDYRHHRPHEAFVANLPIDAITLRQRLKEAWPVEGTGKVPMKMVRQLIEEKYGRREWNYRR